MPFIKQSTPRQRPPSLRIIFRNLASIPYSGGKGNTGTWLPIKPDAEDWGEPHKGRGPLHCSSQLELRKIISRAPPRSGWSWRKPHQRFHSSHFLLLNFKAHIYVPQVAHEPRHVKQFGVDGRGTFSRPGTFRNTISLPVSLPSNFSRWLP